MAEKTVYWRECSECGGPTQNYTNVQTLIVCAVCHKPSASPKARSLNLTLGNLGRAIQMLEMEVKDVAEREAIQLYIAEAIEHLFAYQNIREKVRVLTEDVAE
jgi:hypothetical protein